MHDSKMHVLALELRLRFPQVQTLKEKRSMVRPIIDRLPRLGVSVAEVDDQDVLQSCRLGVVMVSGSARQATETIDEAERLVWSRPDVEVVSAERTWMELDA